MQIGNNIFFAEVERMLAAGQEVQFRVKGYSMRPLLRNERDTVVITTCQMEELKPYDTVLFRYNGRHILHRIVQIDEEQITLAGDGNYRIQEHCRPGDVMAVVRRVIRRSGRTVSCDSRRWRLLSRAWLLLPPLVRRYTLAVLFRLGWK